MTTPVHNVTGAEAGTVQIQVLVEDPDGTPADLTNYTGQIQVRPTDLSDEVLANGTVNFPGEGIVLATIPDDQTVDWSAGVYDVRIESAGGVVEFVVRGTITLQPTVSRP